MCVCVLFSPVKPESGIIPSGQLLEAIFMIMKFLLIFNDKQLALHHCIS